jgi:glutamyl-tRNA synthetase
MNQQVRVRFAPSPTGGLHLGGVRTVLYNFLFAHRNGGKFILRIEDTDQSRFVPGAEQYIYDCLDWCGLTPDESPRHGGAYGPYRQSERKAIYRSYAEKLVASGYAYYAFDTPEELDAMRNQYKSHENPSPQYDASLRMHMRNSLTLSGEEVQALLQNNTRHVIRIRMPQQETVSFTDMIRGEISFNTSVVDDKVLLKADGMPTYHLAVVVDDYLMKITHAFRGEEWLPSAPVHVLLWKYLGWENSMPQWAHLPLILGPSGKLSKRDGAKYGFPVFAMNWTDPNSGELTEGFREKGFLPEAFINLLALLGWKEGSEQEIFSMEELISHFSMDRVHSGGAKFDYEKAKWFNQEWIKKSSAEKLNPLIRQLYSERAMEIRDEEKLNKVISLVKERCTLLPDFFEQGKFFFEAPSAWDLNSVKPKWGAEKEKFFQQLINLFSAFESWSATSLETAFKELAATANIKPGEVLLPFRIMLVGGKYGPGVFEIAELIGKVDTIQRINLFLGAISL